MTVPNRVMITGGPCAGKTTVLEALSKEYGGQLLVMPEVPTILLSNGFPRPGSDVSFSDGWFESFQRAVLPLQENMEDQYIVMSQEKGIPLVVFDRGLIDGAAYFPAGIEAYLSTFNLSREVAYQRYDIVIYLESVAVCNPVLYDGLKATNPIRYETLDEAKDRDLALRQVWSSHPQFHLISGENGIDEVVTHALELIRTVIPTYA